MFTDEGEPLCTAPFTSFLVDVNKGVRPCCVWEGPYLGNLKDSGIRDIINGAEWVKLRRQMMMGLWPDSCLECRHREEKTGWSVRKEFLKGGIFHSDNWKEITYIEFSDSNVCNLACMHCSAGFSNSWIQQEKIFQDILPDRQSPEDNTRYRTHEVHAPDESVINDIVSKVELGYLEQIMIKGGEPMLNSDVALLLEQLDAAGILALIKVNMVTNGTRPHSTLTDRIYNLLTKAREVHFDVSVDGVGDVQEYIRHGKGSDIATIESFIRRFSMIPQARFSLLTSIMAYNIFNLPAIVDWWSTLPFQKSLHHHGQFRLMVVNPAYLSVQCLADKTRAELVERYEPFSDTYKSVVQSLKGDCLGEGPREKLRKFTSMLDEHRGTNLEAVVPELAEDLKLRP
jgi:MoaA/NifB/PqqE/SkfB family radical SAM enzyme